MWLIQLHKAKEDAPIEEYIYITNNCDENYIHHSPYLFYELNLCNDWNNNYDTKKRILILKKKPETTIVQPLRNERIRANRYYMWYDSLIQYNSLTVFSQIFYLEYLIGDEFFIEFYVLKSFYVFFDIPPQDATGLNLALHLVQYIRGKTLNIGIIGSEEPKYSITFDDNCKYYYHDAPDEGGVYVLVVKNPFLLVMRLFPEGSMFEISIGMKPQLIEKFNNYNESEPTYNPDDDQLLRPLRINDIVNQYFDSSTKIGFLRSNVDINDTSEKFSYCLIRALLENFKEDISERYYFRLGDSLSMVYQDIRRYRPLSEMPVCIYFPLLRNQIDSNGSVGQYPQYEPNDPNKHVGSFGLNVELNNNGEVRRCSLGIWQTGREFSDCDISRSGYMPSWRFNTRHGTCDLTRPFRFVGVSDCEAPDEWVTNGAVHNANYLFLIVKPASSNYYNIKGIGCGELRTEIDRFNDFSGNYQFINAINTDNDILNVHRITFSARGYPIEETIDLLDEFEVRTDETCFVLINESLIENASDFISLYQVVTSALRNSVVCYIGDSEKIPNEYRNKVIHSDAIVTDLDTNEQMPLVIKYIRYAKRLHKLFNN